MGKQNDDNDKNILVDENLEDSGSEQTAESVSEENQLKEDFDNLQNQLRRAVADYQNLEKRVAEGRQEFANWANTELIKKLLQVLDYYEKALSGVSEEEKKTSGWVKGVELATQQFKNVLLQEGLDEIEVDGQFDPSLHEAVDTRDGKDGEILEVVEKGYNLNGKVLKPVKVVVGRK
jgi:molecular chaperone GrpE